MKYVFVADASADIPEIYDKDKYNIHIIPIEVDFGEEAYPEGLSNREFYSKLESTGLIPKTAMPNAYKFEQFYKDYANKKDVFVMTIVISFEMSPTKVQAQMAADNLGMKNVFIDECGTTTVPQGAIIGELARFVERNPDVTPEEVIKEFYRLKSKVQIVAIINDLKYLKQSGRLSGTSAMIGTMLNVKPIVMVLGGLVVNVAKVLSSARAEQYLLDKLKDMDTTLPVYYGHSDNLPGAERIAKKAKPLFGENQEECMAEMGYVVASHVGAGCYGFVYFEKDNLKKNA